MNVKETLNNLHNVLPDADVETLLKILDAIVEDNITCPTRTLPQIYYSVTDPHSKFKIIP